MEACVASAIARVYVCPAENLERFGTYPGFSLAKCIELAATRRTTATGSERT